jgi:hypothetical protein
MAEIEMIDDQYWLKFAKEAVTKAITSRDEAATKLDTYLNVVWTIYTSAFAIGTAFNVIQNDFWIRVIMALPIIILPIARLYCIRVQLPVSVQIHFDQPEDIEKNGYKVILTAKNKRLGHAKTLTIISVLSIAVAVFLFKLNVPSKNEQNASKNYYVKTNYSKTCNSLRVDGVAKPDQSLSVLITGADSTKKIFFFKEISKLQSDHGGRFDTTIENKDIQLDIKAWVTWKNENNLLNTIKN